MKKKMRVGYVMPSFTHLSETFIYNYAMDTKTYDAYVFTFERLNADLFPHPRVKVLDSVHKITQAVVEEKIDLLHIHYGPVGLWNISTALELRIPLIVMFHGHDASCLLQDPAWHIRYQPLYQYATRLMAVSQPLRQNLIDSGCPAEKVIVFRPSFKTEDFPYTPPAVDQKVRFLTCSRHVEKKGMYYVIKAFGELVKETGKAVELTIIGEGPLTEDLKAQALPLVKQGYVKFLGSLPNALVAEEMKRCHVFVQASVTAANGDMEGTPVVIAEALATGRPVLGTYHSGIPEMVQHEVSGLLSEEKDVSGLVENMKRLFFDPLLREKMGQNGRQAVEREFSSIKLREELARLYQKELQEFSTRTKSASLKKAGPSILVFRVVLMGDFHGFLYYIKTLYPVSRLIVFSSVLTASGCSVSPLVDEVVVNEGPRFSVADCDQSVLERLTAEKIKQAIIPFHGEIDSGADNLIELCWQLKCQEIRMIDHNFKSKIISSENNVIRQ